MPGKTPQRFAEEIRFRVCFEGHEFHHADKNSIQMIPDVKIQKPPLSLASRGRQRPPPRKGLHRPAVWPTIPSSSRDAGFKQCSRIASGLINHIPRDPTQWNFQPPAPAAFFLARVGADIEIDEARARRTLNNGATKFRGVTRTVPFYSYSELELQILSF